MSEQISSPPPPPRANGALKKRAPVRRRWLPWLGGALLVLLIVVGLWPKAVPVEVANVTRGNLVVTVDEEGMTRVKTRYVVSAPVAGQLRRIEWKAGAVVEAGQTVLAVLEAGGADFLDPRSQAQAEARVRGAEAAREGAIAQRERARAATKMFNDDLVRLKRLFAEKVLSAQEFDTAQMRATTAIQDERAAEFRVQVAEFEWQQARAVLVRGTVGSTGSAEPLVITSPVS
ncbi:MAG: RND transporter, partial [Opitutaceae bacterium]